MFRHEIIITQGLLPFNIVIHNHSSVQITKHWHESIEIDYTIHGDGDYWVSGKKIHVSDNQFIIINSGEVHGVTNIGPGDYRRSLTILIPYKLILKLAPNFDNFRFVSTLNDQQKLNKVKYFLKKIYDLKIEKDGNRFNEVEALGTFYLLMAELLSDFTISKNDVFTFNDIKKPDKVKEIIIFMTENYRESLTLDSIAKHFGLSRSYIDRLFKKEISISLLHYLQLIRLKFAFQEITETDLSISYIADRCGFSNVKSLQKIFKEIYQTSPSDFRKQLRGQ